MKTLFLVMAQFDGAADIPLARLCEEHFGMKLDVAARRAAVHQLPVPFYKKTGKSGYFCSVADWADYLDSQAQAARDEWHEMNGAA